MLCLGIESSCDESALALVKDGVLLSQTLNSQIDVHALFGGVVPELASREHGRSIPVLYDLLLQNSGVSPRDIDCIAVACGPGLLGSLLVGCAFAKGLALALDVPLIAVNHLHAHLLAAGLEHELSFPALGVLVSGGHTHIYLINSPTDFLLIGRSIDDAAGEAVDKFGKMLGLPYPAGRFIDEFGAGGRVKPSLFPRPYLDNNNLDFSFSGLKTSALSFLTDRPELRFKISEKTGRPELIKPEVGQELKDICASFMFAVADTLRVKAARALEQNTQSDIRSIILAGGVAANSTIRASFFSLCSEHGLEFIVASPALCTDNAAMVAYAGEVLFQHDLHSTLDFAAIARGQQVPNDYSKILR